jgi:hypothetical protein
MTAPPDAIAFTGCRIDNVTINDMGINERGKYENKGYI